MLIESRPRNGTSGRSGCSSRRRIGQGGNLVQHCFLDHMRGQVVVAFRESDFRESAMIDSLANKNVPIRVESVWKERTIMPYMKSMCSLRLAGMPVGLSTAGFGTSLNSSARSMRPSISRTLSRNSSSFR